MKLLLFSLVLGLLYAGQGEAQLFLKPFSGEWRTLYIASSNIEKITEDGPFHIYARYIQFNADNTVDIDFYIKSNGECIKKHVTAQPQQNFTYTSEYAGQSEGRPLHVSHHSIIGHVFNVDEEGNETNLVGIIGTDDEISDSDFERFKEETRDKGIPEENIVNFIDNDDCPEE
ncbi:odorant-binding protein-like [Cervus canadensis]|uniref:odorant-binding protein-like n=1 Tax=Cervus canadensis TaxID=1574408 RepID=UPI001CA3841C|nr:odorant-binding protein-like [Cervus canadensis]